MKEENILFWFLILLLLVVLALGIWGAWDSYSRESNLKEVNQEEANKILESMWDFNETEMKRYRWVCNWEISEDGDKK